MEENLFFNPLQISFGPRSERFLTQEDTTMSKTRLTAAERRAAATKQRLKDHKAALVRLAVLRQGKQEFRERLLRSEAKRAAARAEVEKCEAAKQAARARVLKRQKRTGITHRIARDIADLAPVIAAYDAHEAAKKAEEKAADMAAVRMIARAPNAAPTNVPCPIVAIGRTPKARFKATLHDRGGWWELAVFMRRSTFVIPFYQPERPEAMEAHRAVVEEITTRLKMGMAAAKPRKPKAPAMLGQQPRETAKIRRIERQLEGV
jgi:hypothetical protein